MLRLAFHLFFFLKTKHFSSVDHFYAFTTHTHPFIGDNQHDQNQERMKMHKIFESPAHTDVCVYFDDESSHLIHIIRFLNKR